MATVRKKISELTPLNSASLDTTLLGIDNGTTYKIELDTLADAVTARVNILDRDRLSSLESATSSFETKGRSVISSSAQITAFGFVSSSIDITSLNTFTQSVDGRVDSLESATSSYLTSLNGAISSSAQITSFGFISQSTDISSLNSFTASQSILNTAFNNGILARLQTSSFNDFSASVDSRIIAATNEQSFNGLISGSSQLTSSFDTRYAASGSASTLFLLEAYANETYTLPGGFTDDVCRYSIVSVNQNVPSNWFNTSSYTFTPQKAGYWQITAEYDVYRGSGVEASIAIKKNGGVVAAVGSFGAVSQLVTKILYLNGSTDYINIINVGNVSNQRSQFDGRSWFQAKWIGQ